MKAIDDDRIACLPVELIRLHVFPIAERACVEVAIDRRLRGYDSHEESWRKRNYYLCRQAKAVSKLSLPVM